MSALFDFPSLLVVLLLFICSAAYARSLRPLIYNSKVAQSGGDGYGIRHDGLLGICWKASRVGERLSPYVSAACIGAAIYVLFIKP